MGKLALLFILALGLIGCSNQSLEEKKQEGNGSKEAKTTTEKVETTAATPESNDQTSSSEYTFEDFKKLSEQEQKDYIIPLVNKLGYDNDLALLLLGMINKENSDLPTYYKTISEYVTFYINNSDLPSNKLVQEEDDGETNALPEGIKITKSLEKQRVNSIKGKPLYEIVNQDPVGMLGVAIGDDFEDVKKKWGEPDHIGHPKLNGEVLNEYHYYIPASSISKDVNFYQVILRIEEYGEIPNSVSRIYVVVDNKDGVEPDVSVPDEFKKHFQGKVYKTIESEFPYTESGGEANVVYLHDTGVVQFVQVHRKGSDLRLTTQVMGDDVSLFDEAINEEINISDVEDALKIKK